MKQLAGSEIESLLDFESLIQTLETAFAAAYSVPMRHHHNFTNPVSALESDLLLMPAWDNQKYFGVKVVSISPENAKFSIPTIQGMYLLFDIKTGEPLMCCDAKMLTNLRTAAASALASKYLSDKKSKTLLMIGTGALAPQLIKAHKAVRPIEKVYVWGRNFKKTQHFCQQLKIANVEIEAIENIGTKIAEADIISCATLSKKPLVKGAWLREGQHLDLVGSYQKHTREADDDVVLKASIFVDSLESAPKESGDLAIPIEKGILKKEVIKADLFEMCRAEKNFFRSSENEITFFKSVGHALEDLAAASLAFERSEKQKT